MSNPNPYTFLFAKAAQASRPEPRVKAVKPTAIAATLCRCLAVLGETGPVQVPAVGKWPAKTLPSLNVYLVEYPEGATFEKGDKRKRTIRLADSNPYLIGTSVPLPVNSDGTIPVPDYKCEFKRGLTGSTVAMAVAMLAAKAK